MPDTAFDSSVPDPAADEMKGRFDMKRGRRLALSDSSTDIFHVTLYRETQPMHMADALLSPAVGGTMWAATAAPDLATAQAGSGATRTTARSR